MKRKYEKPKVMDLNVPKAWGGDISPMGACYPGTGVGGGGNDSSCHEGWEPDKDGLCHVGWGASDENACDTGIGV